MRRSRQADPFAVLGLPAAAGLTDDQVRAAWRRIAAATHPDRADGGDPAVFAAAAASLGCVLAAGARPATPALITGILTWLVLTARHDLAPPG